MKQGIMWLIFAMIVISATTFFLWDVNQSEKRVDIIKSLGVQIQSKIKDDERFSSVVFGVAPKEKESFVILGTIDYKKYFDELREIVKSCRSEIDIEWAINIPYDNQRVDKIETLSPK